MSAASAANWLAEQPEGSLRIARDIIARRAAYRDPASRPQNQRSQVFESGEISGLRRALSMLSDRPGDISLTGAEGYILAVESSDLMVTGAAANEENARG